MCGASNNMVARVVEHGAPTGRGREHAETQKAERGFCENRAGEADGGLDEDGRQRIGNEVAQENARVRGSERTGREHKLELFDFEGLRAGEARVACPARDHQGQNHFANAGAEECGKGDREQNSRERKKCVDEQIVYKVVEPAAKVAGKRAYGESGESGAQHDAKADEQRDARAVQSARQNVAAQFVGAEGVLPARGT